jgi:predicted RecA/RadA family phage recombinase
MSFLHGTIRYADGRIPFAAPAAVKPGEVVARPDGILVIVDGFQDFASGDLIDGDPLSPCKIAELAAASGSTWSAGAAIYWNATAKLLTTTDTHVPLGVATKAKTAGQVTGLVTIAPWLAPPG